MSHNQKTVLITGGCGFIGSHTVIELLANGYNVKVLDREKPDDQVAEVEYILGEIADVEVVTQSMQGVQYVLHTAAMSRSAPSNELWEECIVSNILGTGIVLKAASEVNVQKFVYCGSSTYYGNQPGPQQEGLPPDMLNVYGITKYAGEEITRVFDEFYDIPTLTLRYFNVYGPGQPSDEKNGLVMGIFLKKKLEGSSVVLDGGGLQTRDFIHVKDVARANRLALESTFRNQVINIGSGQKTSILDLAKLFDLPYSVAPARQGDALTTEADVGKAKELLGWVPVIGLAEGISELITKNRVKK